MKKRIILFLMCASILPSFGEDKFKDVGISEYAVLETTFNYTPIRESASDGAKRFTHLKSGIALFAQKQNSEFYKLDLGLNKPYWIEKRYVEVQGVIPEIRGSNLSKIKFYQNKNNYLVKINTHVQTPYKISQNKDGLEFKLFNVSDYKKRY